MKKIETERLILREWQDSDVPEFVQMNQDPKVMEFFPNLLSEEETKSRIEWQRAHFSKHGYGNFAVELKENQKFIGFVGLSNPPFEAHFMPAIEIGWRLASEHHGNGFATEAAKKILEFGLSELKLSEVVSFTTPLNKPSRRVMEKIGMSHNPQDNFFHPNLPKTHPLALHVLYRIKNS